jgi:phosphoribosylformimino-5-aminoimidazole carboxamide ribotide isomerase
VKLVGKQRLVLDLSCRQRDGQYYVVTDRWQRFSSLALSEATLAQLAASCDEFLVHGVDVEGMQLGIDDALVELLGKWSPIPVTYAGGARTLVSCRVFAGNEHVCLFSSIQLLQCVTC